jgi:hypothetical protein
VGKIYQLFSNTEPHPKTHNLRSANALLPLIRRYTHQAIQETQVLLAQLKHLGKDSPRTKDLMRDHEKAVGLWVERVHRLGGLAKGLWLVDFDTGEGYLCWAYPEQSVEYFHHYRESFKDRRKISLPIGTQDKFVNIDDSVLS